MYVQALMWADNFNLHDEYLGMGLLGYMHKKETKVLPF